MTYNYRQTIYPIRPTLPSRPIIQYPTEPKKPERPAYPDFVYPRYTPPESYLSNYNDPLAINSLADAILTTFNPNMKRWDLKGLEDIPILNIIPSTIQVLYDTAIRPLAHGRWKEFGLNAAMNIGETMDIFANPVKALLQGKGWTGVKRALGVTSEGRYNYDWDTGHWLSDILLEIGSDPLTWIQIGGKIVLISKGKKAIKVAEKAAQEAFEAAIKTGTKEAAEAAAKAAAKEAAENVMSGWVLKSVDSLIKFADTMESILWKGALSTSGTYPIWWVLRKGKTALSEFIGHRIRANLEPYTKFDDTISFIDFDAAKAIYDDSVDSFNKLLGVLKEKGIDKNTFSLIMQDSVIADIKFWTDAFYKYMDDTITLRKALEEFVLNKHSLSSLEEYLQAIKTLNLKTDNAFGTFEDYIQQQMTALKQMEELSQLRKMYDNIHLQSDIIQQTGENIVQATYLFDIDDPVIAAQNLPNLVETAISQELRSRVIIDGKAMPNWTTESIAARARSVVLNHQETIGNHLLDNLIKAYEVTNSPIIQDAITEFDKIIHSYYDDVLKQIDVQAKQAGQIPFIEYDKKHVGAQIKQRLDDFSKRIKKTLEELPDIELTTPKRALDELRELADKGIKQGSPVLDKIVQHKLKNMRSIFDKQIIDTTAVNKIKQKILDILNISNVSDLTKDLEKWATEKLASPVNIPYDMPVSKQQLMDAVYDFLTCDLSNTTKYSECWHTLTNVLNRLRHTETEVLKTVVEGIQDTEEAFRPKLVDFILQHEYGLNPEHQLYKESFESSVNYIKEMPIDNRIELYSHLVKRNPEAFDEFASILSTKVPTQQKTIKRYQELSTILTDLEEVNPYKALHQKMEITADGAYIQFQTEKMHANIALLGDETTNQIITELTQNTGLGAAIQTLARTDSVANDMCAELIQHAQYYRNYLDFLEAVVQRIPDTKTRLALLTTIQNFDEINPAVFMAEFDYNFNRIIHSMQDYVNTKSMPESLSLEALAKSFDLDVGELHTASHDVELLEAIILKKFPDLVKDTSKTYVFCDIETLALNVDAGPILEIACKPLGSAPVKFNIAIDPGDATKIPQERLLNTLFPGQSKQRQLYNYFKRYNTGLTEPEMLERTMEYLQSLGDNVVLIFHNGDEFDVNAILNRMMQYNQSTSWFNRVPKIDTLTELRKKAGYFAVSDTDKITIRQILLQYANTMQGHTKLIDPSSGKLAELCMRLAELSRQAQTNARISRELVELGITSYAHLGDVAATLQALGQRIFAELQNIKSTNKLFNNLLFNRNWVYSHEGRKFFVDTMKEIWGLTDKEIVEKFGSYLNMSKLLYAGEDVINFIGYKNVVNFPAITEWFNFKPGDELYAKQAFAYSSLAKRFDKMYNHIKNPGRLAPLDNAIRDALKILVPSDDSSILKQVIQNLQDAVKNNNAVKKAYWENTLNTLSAKVPLISTFFSKLRTDKADTLSNWVLLQYIFDQYKIKNLLTDELKNSINPDLLKLLYDPMPIYSRVVTSNQLTYLEKMSTLAIDEGVVNVDLIKAEIKEFQKSVDALAKLGEMDDKISVFRAKTQVYAAACKDTADMLELFRIRMDAAKSSTAQLKLLDNFRNYTNDIAMQQLYQILMLPPDQLQSLLAHYGPWITFNPNELMQIPELKNALINLLKNKDLLDFYKIKIHSQDSRMILYLTDTHLLNHAFTDGTLKIRWLAGAEIPAPKLKDIDFERAAKHLNDPEMAEALIKSRQSIHRLSENTSVGSLGDIITPEGYEALFNTLPEEIKKAIDPTGAKVWLHDDFFMTPRFNFTNLGSLSSRAAQLPYTASTVISIYKNSTEFCAQLAKTKIQYAQLYYNSGFSINVGWLKDVSDEDLIRAFKETDEYVLSALVEDPVNGYRVIGIDPVSPEAIAEARRLNAVVMSRQTFSKAYATINSNKFSLKALNFWNKIIYTYKVGYLLEPAVWLCNYVDSTMKTAISTEAGFIEVFGAQIDAMRLLAKYDTCVDDIIAMSPTGRFERKNLELYFKEMDAPLTFEQFKLVHDYIQDGPSAGLTGRWNKYYATQNMADIDISEVWPSFVHLSNKLMKPTSYIEQIQRLSQYLLLLKKNFTNTKAFKIIADTHFDYALKSNWERAMELVFPFYTYAMRNLEYWIDAVHKYPWLMGLFRDIMTPIWNFDDQDYEELKTNQSLQYQILSGNIPLNDKGLTLKLSPSFMDVFNILSDPIDAATSKLAAPLRVIGGLTLPDPIKSILNPYDKGLLEQLPDLLPIAGTMYQRYAVMGPKYYERTNNILNLFLPRLFGGTLRYTPRQYSFKSKKQYIPKTYKKRYYAKRYYAKRYYPKRFYAKKHYAKRSPRKFYARMQRYVPKTYNMVSYFSENFYKKLYTKKGKSRLKQMAVPVSGSTLKYRMRDMYYYYYK